MKFGMKKGTVPNFIPWCNVSPRRGEKPQNRLLRKLNSRRFGLRAMLPVNEQLEHVDTFLDYRSW